MIYTSGYVDEVYVSLYQIYFHDGPDAGNRENYSPSNRHHPLKQKALILITNRRRRRGLGRAAARFVEMENYHAILESIASEQSARMVAMRSATDNAAEFDSGFHPDV